MSLPATLTVSGFDTEGPMAECNGEYAHAGGTTYTNGTVFIFYATTRWEMAYATSGLHAITHSSACADTVSPDDPSLTWEAKTDVPIATRVVLTTYFTAYTFNMTNQFGIAADLNRTFRFAVMAGGYWQMSGGGEFIYSSTSTIYEFPTAAADWNDDNGPPESVTAVYTTETTSWTPTFAVAAASTASTGGLFNGTGVFGVSSSNIFGGNLF